MHIRNWTQLSSDCRNLDEPTWPMNQIRPDLWSGSKRVNGPGRTHFWTKRIQNSLVRHELKVGPTEPAWVGQSQSGPANQVNPTLLFQVSPLPVYGPNSMMTLDGMMTSLLMLFKKKKITSWRAGKIRHAHGAWEHMKEHLDTSLTLEGVWAGFATRRSTCKPSSYPHMQLWRSWVRAVYWEVQKTLIFFLLFSLKLNFGSFGVIIFGFTYRNSILIKNC